MKIFGKMKVDLPGRKVVYFESNKTIQDVLDYINSQLDYIGRRDIPFITAEIALDFKTDDYEDDDDDQSKRISEDIKETGKNSIDLYYSVPKNLAFTQRFQDRIKYDIPNVIESVYDDCKITDIAYVDEDEENMKLTINVESTNENFMKHSKYLDKNVGFIVNDIIEYYNK